jgi:hypothetical protein
VSRLFICSINGLRMLKRKKLQINSSRCTIISNYCIILGIKDPVSTTDVPLGSSARCWRIVALGRHVRHGRPVFPRTTQVCIAHSSGQTHSQILQLNILENSLLRDYRLHLLCERMDIINEQIGIFFWVVEYKYVLDPIFVIFLAPMALILIYFSCNQPLL